MAAPIVAFAAKTVAKWAISAVAADVMVNKLRPYWKPLAAMATGFLLVKAPGKIKRSFRSGINQITWLPRRFNPKTRNDSPSLKFLKVAGMATAVLLGVTALTSGAGLAMPLAVAAVGSYIAGNFVARKASLVERQFSVSGNTVGKKNKTATTRNTRRSFNMTYDQKLSLALKRTAPSVSQTRSNQQTRKVSSHGITS